MFLHFFDAAAMLPPSIRCPIFAVLIKISARRLFYAAEFFSILFHAYDKAARWRLRCLCLLLALR